MRPIYATLIFFVIIAFQANIVYAQDFESKLDSLLMNVFKDKNGPGAVFMIAKDGKPIYDYAFGKANLELGVDLTLDNVFQLGSITKQFTAVAILILEEQNRLDTKDPISNYIPDYPSGDKITIHHLLTHTSGIKDFTKMKSLWDISRKDHSPKELVDFFKNEPVDFLPGEKFEYSNSGYVILGYILELVSGETYDQFIEKHIFEKAGMSYSGYASDQAIVVNRAYGYHKKKHGFENKTSISLTIPFSSGSLMSTADEMLKWQNALNENLLLSSNSLKKAFTKYKLNNGDEFDYGYGWHLIELSGIPIREHGGSVFGFKTMAIYIPSKDIYIIGFSNCDCNSPTEVTREIASLALKTFK